jgi:lipopolysaccharide/colanic/teichoic acid biosynthesis glycosyltransferase
MHDLLPNMPKDARQGPVPRWKRCLDLVVILLLLPVLLLIGLAVALLVKCGSPGPVLFRQRRIGHRGREFTCLKFRTMKPLAESAPHQQWMRQLIQADTPMTKLDLQNDPRLIPFGSLLRATGLDELPQLINVARGEMSLVGPRPCIPYEYEAYEAWHRRRFEAVPGLTGLWQVSGKNQTTFNQMVQLDIEYAERLSLWLDLKILFRTPGVLWRQFREDRMRKRQEAGLSRSRFGGSVDTYRLSKP